MDLETKTWRIWIRSVGEGAARSRTLRQTTYLYSAQIIGIGLAFCVNTINTRKLGPDQYGLYSAIFAVTEFVTLFMDFGFFSSGARVLALRKDSPRRQKEMIGVLILVGLMWSLLAAFSLWTLSFFVVQLLNADIAHLLQYFCALLGLTSLQSLVESLCRGTNRISMLAGFTLTWRALGLLFMGAILYTGNYNLSLAVTASLCGSLLAGVLTLALFRPSFANVRASLEELKRDVRTYGSKAYAGDLACTATSRCDSLILAHYVNPTAVGFYRIATLITTPMVTFSRSLSTALFHSFTDSSRIGRRVFALNVGFLAICLLGILVLGSATVRMVFGMKYVAVANLLPVMGVAALFNGLTQPMNRFLGAHGKGSYLRSIALIMAGCNLVFTFALIPRFGAMGACCASVLIGLISVIAHYVYYYKATAITA